MLVVGCWLLGSCQCNLAVNDLDPVYKINIVPFHFTVAPSSPPTTEMSQDSTSRPASRTSSLSESGSSEAEAEIIYWPQELGAIFLDFYKFLATLHYKPENLKVPPPEGWSFSPEFHAELGKSDLVIQTLRHLPYFAIDDKERSAHVHYKCWLIDFTTCPVDWLEQLRYRDDQGFMTHGGRGDADPADVVCIADGGESYGRQFFLNVRDGSITEDMVRADSLDPVDVQDFFDNLKEAYRSLQLIPCPGRFTIEADESEEAGRYGGYITQDEVLAQTSENWGTDLDFQYIRQLYRQYGWPDNFQREAATQAVDELMEVVQERRDCEWEPNSLGPHF